MSLQKYTVLQISALNIISASKNREDRIRFYWDMTDLSKQYLIEETKQDDCALFYQLLQVTNQSYEEDAIRKLIVYVDFSGIFDRKPTGKVLELQKKAEQMFSPDGIELDFGYGPQKFLAFERSASMSRKNVLSFIKADIYDKLKERITLGMRIGKCQLSKLYAYNGLMFTDGNRIEAIKLSPERIIVIDNPKSIVKIVPVITVEDDGTDSTVRKYHRIETQTDIEVLEFDGEGLVSPEWAHYMSPPDTQHHSFQIRLPYIKGVVHKVDFKALFAELNVPYIIDIWGEKHNPADVQMILTKSMFKGFGWMTENRLSWKEYFDRCKYYQHSLYVSGMDKLVPQKITELNYQFLNTLAIADEEFRPKDLQLGWNHTPEWDNRSWLTKTTETEYWNLVGNVRFQQEYFLSDLQEGLLPLNDRRRQRVELLQKNGVYIDEPVFANELKSKAAQLLQKYGQGQLLVSGDNRYLSDDLLRLLAYMIKNAVGESDAYWTLEKEFLKGNEVYAPNPAYTSLESYILLRSPHIARNEEAIVYPLQNEGPIRQKYLSHLSYVTMVDSRSLIPDRLGGADYDGDMVKTVADPLLNKCIKRNYTGDSYLPLLKIPSAEPLISNADDWHAKMETVKSTFSSRVGQISNAALRKGIVAYDENADSTEKENARRDTEILAILTGLEIDSAKSGIKPDLSECLTGKANNRSLFLRYKAIVGTDDNERDLNKPSKTARLKKIIGGTDWNSISSNLEKLPYYAYMLEQETEARSVVPADDKSLFDFVRESDWQRNLNPNVMERMKSVISAYEEALRRVRFFRHSSDAIKRDSDIRRILFSMGKEEQFSAEELYALFDDAHPSRIRASRLALQEQNWQFVPAEERQTVIYAILPCMVSEAYRDLFCDFRHNGYRILGNIICDLDDMYRKLEKEKNIVRKTDSKDLAAMLSGVMESNDYKQAVIRNCIKVLNPPGRKENFDTLEGCKCAIALGKREFAMEVMPSVLLELTTDRSHIYGFPEEGKSKRRRRSLK